MKNAEKLLKEWHDKGYSAVTLWCCEEEIKAGYRTSIIDGVEYVNALLPACMLSDANAKIFTGVNPGGGSR